MIGEIQQFDFHSNMIRLHVEGEQVEYCAKDIAVALGYKDTINAIKRHCKGVVKRHPLETAGGMQEAAFIGEGDVYRLIASSKLPAAVEFEHWMFDEVLPSIRKHGGYMMGQEHMTPEQMVAASMRWLESRIAEQQKQLDAQAPKVLFADTVSGARNSITVGVLAKLLKQKGAADMGQNRLFAKLRDDGYLCKQRGENWNMPTQYAMERGLFNVKERTVANPDGSVRVTRTTMVTGRGQLYFVNKYADRKQVEA